VYAGARAERAAWAVSVAALGRTKDRLDDAQAAGAWMAVAFLKGEEKAQSDAAARRAELDLKYFEQEKGLRRSAADARTAAEKTGYAREEELHKRHLDRMLEDLQLSKNDPRRQAWYAFADADAKALAADRKRRLEDAMAHIDPASAGAVLQRRQLELKAMGADSAAIQKYTVGTYEVQKEQVAIQRDYLNGQIARLEMEQRIAIATNMTARANKDVADAQRSAVAAQYALALRMKYESPVAGVKRQLEEIRILARTRPEEGGISPERARILERATIDQALNEPTGEFGTMASRWQQIQSAILEPQDFQRLTFDEVKQLRELWAQWMTRSEVHIKG
jgi:hypothetical protein